jgi:hypothetical protein
LKFTDMLQRVDCYHGMFLNQTEMLMCGQLEGLAKEFEKIKVLWPQTATPNWLIFTNWFHGVAIELWIRFTPQEMRQQVKKASHDLNLSWEKFSSCQNITNLQEVCVVLFCI